MMGMPQEAPVPCVVGAPSWLSLLTPDPARAQEFYGTLLGWEFRAVAEPESRYVHALVGPTRVAGIGAAPDDWQASAAWTVFFGTADIDAAAHRVEERAGTVGIGPHGFNAGRIALATDPFGARFGLWQGAPGPARHLRLGGAPDWVELATGDAFDAAVFYGTVLDWDSCSREHLDVHYEHERVVVRVQGHNVAALRTAATAGSARWEVSFAVSDVAATAALAQRLGGQLLAAPAATAYGPTAVLTDPQGAPFSVITPH